MAIRDKLKKIVRSDRRNKKDLNLKDLDQDNSLDPGTGFDAASGLQPPLSATRPSTAISQFAPRLETPPISPTALLPPSPPFSKPHHSRSRSTTNSSRPESSDSYASSLANQSQTAATSNITTPPNGMVASTPTSAGGSRMSLSRFKWGSRISLRSNYSGNSDHGEKEGRKLSRDSGPAVAHAELGTSLGAGSHIQAIEENFPDVLSEEDEEREDYKSPHIDHVYDFERIREEVGLHEVNNYFGRYLSDDNDLGEQGQFRGRSPYGQYDTPGFQQPGSTFDSSELQSPSRNMTFFGDDSDSETSSNYEKSFVSHDTSSLHNYISQFTADDYRSAVGHISRPPSRTSSECLPLDREFLNHHDDTEPQDTEDVQHEPEPLLSNNQLSALPLPTPKTSVTFERTVFPPIVHESYQEQQTEVQHTHIVREIHTHEYREIEIPIKDERPDEQKQVKSPVRLIRDGEGNLWPMIDGEISTRH